MYAVIRVNEYRGGYLLQLTRDQAIKDIDKARELAGELANLNPKVRYYIFKAISKYEGQVVVVPTDVK